LDSLKKKKLGGCIPSPSNT